MIANTHTHTHTLALKEYKFSYENGWITNLNDEPVYLNYSQYSSAYKKSQLSANSQKATQDIYNMSIYCKDGDDYKFIWAYLSGPTDYYVKIGLDSDGNLSATDFKSEEFSFYVEQ